MGARLAHQWAERLVASWVELWDVLWAAHLADLTAE